MGLYHAKSGEVVDVRTWGDELPAGKTKAIIKTDAIELLRLSLPAGKEIPTHRARGDVVIHCIEGAVSLSIGSAASELRAGQLVHIDSGAPHSLRAISDSFVLLTVVQQNRERREGAGDVDEAVEMSHA